MTSDCGVKLTELFDEECHRLLPDTASGGSAWWWAVRQGSSP